jgi:Uncharacterized protein involved in exopolysaccharide biosynthesis
MSSKKIEIDFFALARKLWADRRIIIKTTIIAFVLGLLVALLSSKVYTAQVTMIPQFGADNNKSSGIAGLAAMAGVNVGQNTNSDFLSPMIYPKIMNSITFQKDLMYSKIYNEKTGKEITLYDFFTNEEYQSFNLARILKKYTIGLPGVILKSIRKKETLGTTHNSDYHEFNMKEEAVSNTLKSLVTLSINDKEGFLVLQANMPDAKMSFQVVESARLILQKYIIMFKVNKINENKKYLEARSKEAEAKYELKQKELALFRDSNRNITTATAKVQEERLYAEFNLLFNIYSELSRQLEQTNLKIKETQPTLAVVSPAFVPNQKTKPKRFMIILVYTFMGCFLGVLVKFISYLQRKDESIFKQV